MMNDDAALRLPHFPRRGRLRASCSPRAAAATSRPIRARCGWSTQTSKELDLYEDDDRLTPDVAPFAAGNYEDLNKGNHTLSVRGGVAGATLATLDADVPENTHLAIVAYSDGGTPTLTMTRRKRTAREGLGEAALLQHRRERQRRRRHLPPRHRYRCATSPPPRRRRSRPTCRACKPPSPPSTGVRTRAIACASRRPTTRPMSASAAS